MQNVSNILFCLGLGNGYGKKLKDHNLMNRATKPLISGVCNIIRKSPKWLQAFIQHGVIITRPNLCREGWTSIYIMLLLVSCYKLTGIILYISPITVFRTKRDIVL